MNDKVDAINGIERDTTNAAGAGNDGTTTGEAIAAALAPVADPAAATAAATAGIGTVPPLEGRGTAGPTQGAAMMVTMVVVVVAAADVGATTATATATALGIKDGERRHITKMKTGHPDAGSDKVRLWRRHMRWRRKGITGRHQSTNNVSLSGPS